MSGDEGFLARWSRRKRRAAPKPPDPPRPEAAMPPAPLVEAADLPPIESIVAGTDIRAFLAAGVPADLTRAALRRAWSADPAIRDFIGLSENSWDFTAPGGVPGFGTVTAEDVRRLLARAMGEPDVDDPAPAAPETASADQATAPAGESGPAAETIDGEERADRDASAALTEENTAAQHESGKPDHDATLARRSHGGALPK